MFTRFPVRLPLAGTILLLVLAQSAGLPTPVAATSAALNKTAMASAENIGHYQRQVRTGQAQRGSGIVAQRGPDIGGPTVTEDQTEPDPITEVSPPPEGDGTTAPEGETAPPPSTVDRLGLHVTKDELKIWRQRAAGGPYRAQGDVSSNSPGDWERILGYAGKFAAAPSAGRWAGPVANNPDGCVVQVNKSADDTRYVPPYMNATYLRDAAFVAMVEGNQGYAAAVRDELISQALVPGVDFSDRSRFCFGTIAGDNNPVFNIANWLTRLTYAYDYVRISFPELLGSTDRQLLDQWFADAAEWMQEATDSKLDELFVDRSSGDYRLTAVATNDWRNVLYLGGPEARTLQRRYNNRAAASLRYVALVGVNQGNSSFVDSAKRFTQEFIQFSYFPEGALGEFERWTSNRPILGWKYSVLAAGSLITIADTLARAGDPSLYTYETTNGALGTEGSHFSGAPKSLATLINDLMGYVDHRFARYGTMDASRQGDDRYLIDSRDELNGDESVHDTMLTMSNRFYGSTYVKSVYERTAPGTPGYPSSPTHGQGDPEGGEWGTYPGALLMFGGLEGASNPYPN